ncbi:hypothetical protein [Streptantibioticus silvisoli]|uniref:Uncharacterized protein n=1 Tax=Streptantibioticus silvisoli TaxID=2705255 RepID=A0ABT6VZM6_9ACTN|nr:hypothetical protein [Streptantibioticus silvisoli]MDI5962913.1 hypothetical protein [Streptantibioticus silvisoli]
MTAGDGGDGRDDSRDERGDDAETDLGEFALRRLLEAGVPRLSAPADRMRQVHRRVVRRRRRRAAMVGAVTCVAAILALAGPLARGPARDDTALPAGVPPLAAIPTVGDSPVGAAAAGPGGWLLLPFGGTDIGVVLPRHWQAEMVPGNGFAVGYATDGTLGPPKSCPDPAVGAFACLPVKGLPANGMAFAFLAGVPKDRVTVAHKPFEGGFFFKPPRSPRPDKDCAIIGGTREMEAIGGIGHAMGPVAYVCMRGTSQAQLDLAKSVLDSAVFFSKPATD